MAVRTVPLTVRGTGLTVHSMNELTDDDEDDDDYDGRHSSVGIADSYGLNGPGSNPLGARFTMPAQPPLQWVPSLSRG